MTDDFDAEYDPQSVESSIRKYWDSKDIADKVKEGKKGGKNYYIVHPPELLKEDLDLKSTFSNILLDVWTSYQIMKNHNIRAIHGYDSCTLKVEDEALGEEKTIDQIQGKEEQTEFYNSCKEVEKKWGMNIKNRFKKLGVWYEREEIYKTTDQDYINSLWWTVSQLFDQGLIKKRRRILPWCKQCQVGLSARGIQEGARTKYNFILKFPVKKGENRFVIVQMPELYKLISTKTLALHPEREYSVIKYEQKGRTEKSIILKENVEKVFDRLDIDEYEEINVVSGEKLEGMKYLHPLANFIPQQEEEGKIITSIKVPKEETGIFSISPGLERDRYEVVSDNDLDIYSPLNRKGEFTEEVYEGEDVSTPTGVNNKILQDLKEENLLLGQWRADIIVDECSFCMTELIYRECEEWFLNFSGMEKEESIFSEVEWTPQESTPEDFETFLRKANECPITRRKGWGIPFPLWTCDCGQNRIFKNIKELSDETSISQEDDIRPDKLEDIEIECPKCGDTMEWVGKVFTPLFVSSASPWAQLGYPKKKDQYRKWWPGKIMIGPLTSTPGLLEGNLSLNFGLFEEPSVERLVVRGSVEGEMDFSWVSNIMGYDSLRVELLSDLPPWGDRDLPLSAMRKKNELLLVWWNIYNFYKEQETRLELDLDDIDIESFEDEFLVEERWLLSRIQTLKNDVNTSIEEFSFDEAISDVKNFVIEDMAQWYIGLVRSHLTQKDKTLSKQILATLRRALIDISKLMAPISPHISEEVFTTLIDDKESVHLSDWPEENEGLSDPMLEKEQSIIKNWVDKIIEGKDSEALPRKWPLRRVIIDTDDDQILEMTKRFMETIKNRSKVKEIDIVEPEEDWEEMEVIVEPNYDAIGNTYQQWTSRIALLLSKREPERVMRGIQEGEYRIGIEGNMIDITEDMVSITRKPPEEFRIIDVEGGSIYLDFEVTDEIWDEQIAHEVKLRLKSMRQNFELGKEDEVNVYINAPEEIFEAVDLYRDEIEKELGSRKIESFDGELEGAEYILEWDINQEIVEIGMVPLYKTEVIDIYESIPGMSKKLARKLYEKGFTSLEIVQNSSAGDISSLDGFKRSLARRIKQEVKKKQSTEEKEEKIKEEEEKARKLEEVEKGKEEFLTTIQDIFDIDPNVSQELYDNGFTTLQDISEANIEELGDINQIEITEAEELRKIAKEKIREKEVSEAPSDLTEQEIVENQRQAMAEEMEEEEYRSAIEKTEKKEIQQKGPKVTEKEEVEESRRKGVVSKEEFMSKLQRVSQVGPARAEDIYENGYTTFKDILEANLEDLADISHINIPRAEELKNVAKEELDKGGEDKTTPTQDKLKEEEIVKKQKQIMAEEMEEESLHAVEEQQQKKETIEKEKREKGSETEKEKIEEEVSEEDLEEVQTEEIDDRSKVLDMISKSSTYLLIDEEKEKSFKIFRSLIGTDQAGFCVSRKFPDKIREKYGLSDVKIVWLSNVGKGSAVGPKELDKLSLEVEGFLSSPGGVILFMGIEYLITNNDFNTVLHLIQSLKDQVAIKEAVLLIPIRKNAIEEQHLDMLESEIDKVFTL